MSIRDITQTGELSHSQLQEENAAPFSQGTPRWKISASTPYNSRSTVLDDYMEPSQGFIRDLGVSSEFGNSSYDVTEDASLQDILDYENLRGQRQSGLAKLGSGIAKGVALAATTFLDGTLGLIAGGIEAASTGRISALWDNDVSNALQDINRSLEEILPNYRTQEEQERPWYQNLGTMNFWADSVIKNLGFTVGAFYSGGVWTKGLKAAGILKKGLSSSVVGSLMSGLNEGRIEANNGQRDFLELQNAQIEDAYNQKYQEIIGSNSSDEDKLAALTQLDKDAEALRQDALERGHAMGLTTLIGNTILLTASNMWQFGKLYSKGFANHAEVKAAAKAAGKEAPTIMEEGARLKAADDMMSKLGNRYVAKTTSRGKALLRGTSNGLAEGFEEMSQQWIQSGAGEMYSPDSPDAYYEALVNHNSQLATQGFLTGMAKGFTESYGDGSQWEQFAVGTLTGLFGMPTFGRVNNADATTYLGRGKAVGISGGLFGEMRNAKEQNALNTRTADAMNKYLDKIEAQTSHFVQSKSFTDAMDGFAADKNRFEYQNASDNDDFAAIAAFATAGRLSDLKDIINQDFENISDEELASIARNTTPNVTINEEGNAETKDQNGNVLTGGWRAADGTLLSDTEEGRKQMKEELVKKRDKMIKAVDDYEQSVNLVRGIANNQLNDDQLNELAWLHWKGKQFTDRYNSIKGEQSDILQRLRQIANEISEAPFESNRDVLLTNLQNKYNSIVSDRQSIEEALELYTQEEASLRENLQQTKAQLEQLKEVATARESVINAEQQRRLNAIERGGTSRQKRLERAQNLQQIAAAMSEQKSRNEKIQSLEASITGITEKGKEISRKKLNAKKRLATAKQAEKDAKHEYDMVFYNDDTENLKSLHKAQSQAAGNLRDFLDYLSTAENPVALASRIEANEKIVNALSNPVVKAILQSRLGEDGENIDRFLESLQDTAKIAKAAKTFGERLEEFRKNPLNIQKRRNKIKQKAEAIKQSREDSKKRKTVETASVNELVNSDLDLDDLEGVLGSDTPEDGVTTMQGSSKQKVKEAKTIRQQVSNMEDAINRSNAPEQTKKDARVLLNNGKLTSEDLSQLQDLTSEAYNDPSSLEVDASMIGATPEEMQEAMQQRVDAAKSLLSEMQAAVAEQNAEDDNWIAKWGAETNDEINDLINRMASAEEIEAEKARKDDTTGHDGVEDGMSIQDETARRNQAEEARNAAMQNPMRAGNQADIILDEAGLDKEQYHELATNMVKSFYDMTKQGVPARDALVSILSNDDFAPILQNANASVALQNFIQRWRESKMQQTQATQAQQESPREIPTPEISQESVDKDKNTDNARIKERNDQSLAENTLGNIKQYWRPTTTLMPIHSIGRGRKFYSDEYLKTTTYSESYKKKIKAVGEYLERVGAFDRVDRGEIQKGDKVHFVIDSTLNADAGEIIILMAKEVVKKNEHGEVIKNDEGNEVIEYQVIGDVAASYEKTTPNYVGLSSFISRVQKEYQEAGSPEYFVSKEVSEIDKRLIGKVPYSTQSHTLNEVHTDNGTPIPFKLGVAMSSGRMSYISTSYRTTRQGQSEEEKQILPPLNATAGQPYLIMPTGDTKSNNRFIAVPFIMDKFGPNNMNTQLGQAIQTVIRDIIKGDNNKAGSLRLQIEELLSANIHINYDGQGNLWIRLGEGEQARTIFDSRNNTPGILNNLTEDSTNDLVRQISLGLQGTPFQVNRKYLNTTYKGQDYNRMIGEIATINLGIGDTHTISNWFTVNPISEDGTIVRAKSPKTTRTNPNAASNRLITFPLSDGKNASVDLGAKEVYIDGNLYTEDTVIRDKYLAHAYGIHSNKDMNQPYQSEWGYYNPVTFKFEAAPTTAPIQRSLGANLITPQPINGINTTIETTSGNNVKVSVAYDSSNALGDRLANTHFNEDGSCIITINNNLTLDQFFDYILGRGANEGDNTPQAQKVAVFNRLKEQSGITEEILKEIINTPEKAKELLLEHELSHIENEHREGYYDENEDRKNPNYLTEKKVDREYEATLEALRIVNRKYATDNVKMAESMYGGYFEGGGAIIENDYHIDENDEEAKAAISAFENASMFGIPTNSIAKRFLEVIKKYAPEQYANDKKTFSERTQARQEEPSSTSSRPQESNLQKSNEELAKAKGLLGDATSRKAFAALTEAQQAALLNIQGPRAKQLMMQIKLHFRVRDNKFSINVSQLLGLEGKYEMLRDTSLDSKPFDFERDLPRELKWMAKALPQFSKQERIQLIKGLMTMDGDSIALGMFKDGIIYLNSEVQRRGTVYHEAFHAVFDTLLSEEERQAIYDAAKEQFGNLDVLSLEEKLAEDFRQYVEYEEYAPNEGLRNAVVRFWRKLKRMVNHLLGKDSTINALFYNINKGKYSNRSIQDVSGEAKYMSGAQEVAKDIFFKEVYNQDLTEGMVADINRRLQRLSDSVGDMPWHLRVSSKGNYYIAGYKNWAVTSDDYYTPYGSLRTRSRYRLLESTYEYDSLSQEDRKVLSDNGISQEEYNSMNLTEKEFLLNHCR